MEFKGFPKIGRLRRNCVITEKIDGTNAQVCFTDQGEMFVGSRNRWITPQDDNYGFAGWCERNRAELEKLGPGQHFGEWHGPGIQKRYGGLMKEKVFSLFQSSRWADPAVRPACCSVVPVLYQGVFTTDAVDAAMAKLIAEGSVAVPGCMNPEGVVVYQVATGQYTKVTVEHDESPKSLVAGGE
jgi:hypothetical protein